MTHGDGSSKVHDHNLCALSQGACGLVWSMLVALGTIDPGSNPGRPTTRIFLIKAVVKLLQMRIYRVNIEF